MSFPWRTALFVSLAFNVIVVSAAVGAFASGARLARPVEAQAANRLLGQRAFMRALPADARIALRRELAGELLDARAQRAAARQARGALYEAVRADPYDRERVRSAFAAVRAADAALAERFHDALADGFGRIDANDRAAALEALARQYPRSGSTSPEAEPGSAEAPPLDDEARRERRERFREKMRERREQRLQQP